MIAQNRKESSTALEAFGAPQTEQITTFETDELTALCPFDFGGPDFYELTIRYEPDAAIVETRSLKEYIKSFRATEITAEGLGVVIHSDVVHEADPSRCYVRLEQAIRGGIQETVEVGDMDLAESR